MTKKNSNGFGALEGLLVIVLVGIIGFAGWYVWNAKESTDKTIAATNKTSQTMANRKQDTPMKVNEVAWSKVSPDLQKAILASWEEHIPGWKTVLANDEACAPGQKPVDDSYLVREDESQRYAAAGVGCDSPAAGLWAKKDGSWQQVEITQGTNRCDLLEKYNVPKAFLAAAYNPDIAATCVTAEGTLSKR